MKVAIFHAVLTVASVANAQGTFGNLDFESANLSGYSPGSAVPIASALPGWSGFIAGGGTDQISYDSFALAGGSISIMDSHTTVGYPPLQGNYSPANGSSTWTSSWPSDH